MAKEDYLYIAKLRKICMSQTHIQTLTVGQLNAMLQPITYSENYALQQHGLKRQPYLQMTVADLKLFCKQNNLHCTGSTKLSLIDNIIQAFEEQINYDEDQLEAINRCFNPELIIVAGPGAGKTTTLCGIVRRLTLESNGRILILAFNKNAEYVLKSRLKKMNVEVGIKKNVVAGMGCFVLTFDKYVYHTRTTFANEGGMQDYRLNFEYGLQLGVKPYEKWDWLIIDEGQDIQPLHAILIEQLRPRAKHFIVAGDPRQELYPGAEWFSSLCSLASSTSKITVLRYNHRSTPEVVDLLNKFSRAHFPTLHHEQVATRSAGGSVTFEVSTDPGLKSGSWLTQYARDEAYCITPITVTKFTNDALTKDIRQMVHDHRPGTGMTIMDDNYHHPGTYFIGTARKLKGTERKAVIVFGIDNMYEDYGIPRECLIKSIFVALSRGQDHVHVILTRHPAINEIMATVVPDYIPVSMIPISSSVIPDLVKVWDDLTKMNCWTVSKLGSFEFDPIDISIEGDADFVGTYLEIALASALGVNFKVKYSFTMTSQHDLTGMFKSNDGYLIKYTKDTHFGHFDSGVTDEYKAAMCKFSAETTKAWTLSERFAHASPKLGKWPLIIQEIISGPIEHGKYISFPIVARRSNIHIGKICGQSDLSTEKDLIELKHAVPNIRHEVQACVYAALQSGGLSTHNTALQSGVTQSDVIDKKETAVLVNTKTGSVSFLSSYPLSYVVDVSRSYLAFKQGQIARGKLSIKLPLNIMSSVFISVDIESEGPYITEIGAWAFGFESIYGVYNDICPGTIVDYSSISGLIIKDVQTVKNSQNALIGRFHQWIASVSNRCVFLQWSGNDTKALRINGPVIDVFDSFCTWLQLTGQYRDTGRTLTDAVSQILGPAPFSAHRAFEDAVMTGAIFIAITHSGGSV